MKNLQIFLKNSFIGGFLIILPVAALAGVLKWIYSFIVERIDYLPKFINYIFKLDPEILSGFYGELLALAITIVFCAVLGATVKTRLGNYLYQEFEENILCRLPGFKLIKDTINQFAGGSNQLFKEVALVRLFENDVRVTAFVTNRNPDGSYTIFMPTAPNPTSGLIYHVSAEYVEIIDISIEDAMKTIISVGAGSEKLIEKSHSKN